MINIIKSFDEITEPWLEACLDKRYPIKPGTVNKFRIKRQFETPLSQIAIIEITYSHKDHELPLSLFIKIAKPNEDKNIGYKEVYFYNQILPNFDNRSDYLCCYYANYDNKLFNLVLEDISDTHFNTEWPLPPSIEHCEMAIDCLAKLHASWWEHKDLEKIIGKFPLKQQFLEEVNAGRKVYEDFIDFMGDRLSGNRKKILLSVMDNYDLFIDRFATYKSITFIHNDNHLWNFMFPKNERDKVKIIDWQYWEYGLGTEDLANMLAMHWYPERRKMYEMKLLKRYHNKLAENGINNYSFDDFLLDYRWSIFSRLACHPIFQWSMKAPAIHWYNNFEKIIAAYEEWNCAGLLKRAGP